MASCHPPINPPTDTWRRGRTSAVVTDARSPEHQECAQVFVRHRSLVVGVERICFKPEKMCHRCHLGIFQHFYDYFSTRDGRCVGRDARAISSAVVLESSSPGDFIQRCRLPVLPIENIMKILFSPCLRSSLDSPLKAIRQKIGAGTAEHIIQ